MTSVAKRAGNGPADQNDSEIVVQLENATYVWTSSGRDSASRFLLEFLHTVVPSKFTVSRKQFCPTIPGLDVPFIASRGLQRTVVLEKHRFPL